jgi:hypothetical protein
MHLFFDILECADMSALWEDATCRIHGKRCHATAVQSLCAWDASPLWQNKEKANWVNWGKLNQIRPN